MGLGHQGLLANAGHVENYGCHDVVHHLRVPIVQGKPGSLLWIIS